MTLFEIVRLEIINRLVEFGGVKSLAADSLGITTRTLYNHLSRYGYLNRDDWHAILERIRPEEDEPPPPPPPRPTPKKRKEDRRALDMNYICNLIAENKRLKQMLLEQ